MHGHSARPLCDLLVYILLSSSRPTVLYTCHLPYVASELCKSVWRNGNMHYIQISVTAWYENTKQKQQQNQWNSIICKLRPTLYKIYIFEVIYYTKIILPLKFLLYLFIHMCMHACICVPWSMDRSQRTTMRDIL